jgi:chromosome segregation ATPase
MQNRQAQRAYRERKEQEIKRLCRELAELKDDHTALQAHVEKVQLELDEVKDSYHGLLAASMPLDSQFYSSFGAGVEEKVEADDESGGNEILRPWKFSHK